MHSLRCGAIIAATLERKTETAKAAAAKVLLDHKELSLPDNIKTVQDLLIHVQAAVLTGDRVLQTTLLDGEMLTDKGERDAHTMLLSDYCQVELQTRKVLDLAVDGLTDAQDIIPAITNNLRVSVKLLRVGDIEGGIEMLYESVQMMDWYIELVHAIEAVFHQDKPWLRQKHAENTVNSEEFKTFQSKTDLMHKFNALEQYQEAQDYGGVADIVEYTILPVIEQWWSELPSILAKMKAESAEA